ncbi:MAG: T9SS type A sorting domain-containing protein, partial [Bacteroidales bacterium]|nr:T9SS type A sorting domain-containing protein [Bacteroidales bacterium]
FSVSSEDEVLGEAWVTKEATCEDMSVEVLAIPSEGCSFLYWEAEGEQISSENPYNFILERDTRLVAHFSGTGVAERESVCVVYPNPTQDQLLLQYSPDVEPKLVELYDLQGRLVRTQRNGLESIDMSQLPTGTYTMRVTLEDGKTFSDKVVKE